MMVALHFGALGVALHRDFPADLGMHMYWSCRSAAPLGADAFFPEEEACSDDAAAMTGLRDGRLAAGAPARQPGSTASSGGAQRSASIAS
jgi:hypothetical protein